MTNPPTPPLVLGLAGCRQTGKDTLFSCLRRLNPGFQPRAFASRLKEDTASLIRDTFGFDPDNLTPEQKEIVRPLWIGFGVAHRARDPLHWVKVVIGDIDHQWAYADTQFIPAVTDCRYTNEAEYLRMHYGSSFRLVNLTRAGSPPPTEEEERHFRQVAALADFQLHWGNDDEAAQLAHARTLLAWLGVPEVSATNTSAPVVVSAPAALDIAA